MSIHTKLLLLLCMGLSAYCNGQDGLQTAITTTEEKSSCNGNCCCADDSQAPAGIMTDHIHPKGKWMVSYSYMDMMMKGNHIGNTKASDEAIYKNYMMAPATMSMQMHMVMLMYGVTDRLTLMAMGGYAANNMSMNMDDNMMSMPGMSPGSMSMSCMSSGFTDTRLSALYRFTGNERARLIGSMGVNFPTGTVRETGTTMLGENQRLPYNMQLGTGSYGLLPGITFIRQSGLFSFGLDAGADIKTGNNSVGYRFGNVYRGSAWASYKFLRVLSGSLRIEGIETGKISGSDPNLNIAIYQQNDPTTVTSNYGGVVSNLYAGLNFHFKQPLLSKFNVLAEYGLPIYQNLNGTQMSLHATLLAGLQYSF